MVVNILSLLPTMSMTFAGIRPAIVSSNLQQPDFLLTPLEPKGNMGETVKTLVASLRYVGVKHRSTESLFLIPDDDEPIISRGK